MRVPVNFLLLLAAFCVSSGLSKPRLEIDDGYMEFESAPGSRYKLYPFDVTWAEAFGACQSDGGGAHLVVINDAAEAGVVRELMAVLMANVNAHVGIEDLATEDTWLTVLGGFVSASGYNQWTPGKPNGGVAANCGFVSGDALYNDGDCTAALPFICEMPNA